MSISKYVTAAMLVLATGAANAGVFTNGGFEDGNTSGWTTGGGYRGNLVNSELSPASFLPGGANNNTSNDRSSIISAGTVDPVIGAALGGTVYSGKYSYRSEDTTFGGYASVISQKVTNYTDSNIFFAWKAVLENGGHVEEESAAVVITLTDNTTGQLLISRTYNAGDGGGGIDSRFTANGDLFYTAQWQIEQLAIDDALRGHDFTLSLLTADCNPTGHTGYAYIDGFGAVVPPPVDVPEPASIALMLAGMAGVGVARRRKKA